MRLEKGLRKPQEWEREEMFIKKCYDGKLFPYYTDTLFSNSTQQLYIFNILNKSLKLYE